MMRATFLKEAALLYFSPALRCLALAEAPGEASLRSALFWPTSEM